MSERYNQLERFLIVAAKSGIINTRYILEEMVKELNLSPSKALNIEDKRSE